MSDQVVSCEGCGAVYGIGDSPYCKDGHAPWWQRKNEFKEYFDWGIGKTIHDHGERTREMKRNKLDYRARARGEPNGWEY
jgi:hypothetical protein